MSIYTSPFSIQTVSNVNFNVGQSKVVSKTQDFLNDLLAQSILHKTAATQANSSTSTFYDIQSITAWESANIDSGINDDSSSNDEDDDKDCDDEDQANSNWEANLMRFNYWFDTLNVEDESTSEEFSDVSLRVYDPITQLKNKDSEIQEEMVDFLDGLNDSLYQGLRAYKTLHGRQQQNLIGSGISTKNDRLLTQIQEEDGDNDILKSSSNSVLKVAKALQLQVDAQRDQLREWRLILSDCMAKSSIQTPINLDEIPEYSREPVNFLEELEILIQKSYIREPLFAKFNKNDSLLKVTKLNHESSQHCSNVDCNSAQVPAPAEGFDGEELNKKIMQSSKPSKKHGWYSGGGAGESTNKKEVSGKSNYNEGQLKDRQFNGYGTFTWPCGMRYTGEFLAGERHGLGVQIWPNGQILAGDFFEGDYSGQGSMIWQDGRVYTGDYKESQRHGIGSCTWTSGQKYEGDFEEGNFSGQGKLVMSDGRKYSGGFKHGKMHGKGELTWSSGQQYIGEFKHDQRCGQGKLVWPYGNIYIGEWTNDMKHGRGITRLWNGTVFDGWFKENKKQGKGTILHPSGIKYQGEFKNDMRNGRGRTQWPDGQVFTGDFRMDKKHGPGEMALGEEVKYTGEWKNGLLEGKVTFIDQNSRTAVVYFEEGKPVKNR